MSRAVRFTVAAALLAAPLAVLPAHASSPPAYTVQTLHFAVTVGPADDRHCDIVGDVYKPRTASAKKPVPAILTTNGFGGSKADQAGLGQLAASKGYAVLSYSGLGFGGSSCKIELDDRDWDGKAGSQLVSFLGGAPDIGFTDAAHTQPVAPIDYVVHDRVAHDGRQHANDPRVGMIGGSYGGQIQFAVAGIDPRLDTIIPIITWNDLSYSLAPNNTNKVHGVTYGVRGTEKVEWTSLFFGLGIVDGLQGAQTDPKRNLGCPNFDNRVCRSKVQMDATGFPSDQTLAMARHASVESFLWRIKIPVLLAQGENDTLFNLNEAAATYLGLKMYHVPVSMIWQSWGHSGGPSSPGEYSGGADALSTYEGQRFFAWFNHYLKGSKASTGPNFSYFRDWVPFTGSGPDTVQYATAPSYPVGSQQSLYLSGTNALVSKATAVVTGASSFVAPAQSPSSYSETSALQGSTISDSDTPPRDAPGTFAAWTSDALTTSLKVAGIPTVTLHVRAPTATVTQAAYAAGRVLLFVKLYDVAPDGTVTLVHRLVSPARVLDVRQPVTITLPGIVHQFAAGHRLQLVVAGSDAAYRNNTGPVAVSIPTSASSPSILTLPVVRR